MNILLLEMHPARHVHFIISMLDINPNGFNYLVTALYPLAFWCILVTFESMMFSETPIGPFIGPSFATRTQQQAPALVGGGGHQETRW